MNYSIEKNRQIEILNGTIIEREKLNCEYLNTLGEDSERCRIIAYRLRQRITELDKSIQQKLKFIESFVN